MTGRPTAPTLRGGRARNGAVPFAPGRANVAAGANANSLHSPGRAAFAALEGARRSIAADLHASRASEIVFTSGATEADNAALLGLARAALEAPAAGGAARALPARW